MLKPQNSQMVSIGRKISDIDVGADVVQELSGERKLVGARLDVRSECRTRHAESLKWREIYARPEKGARHLSALALTHLHTDIHPSGRSIFTITISMVPCTTNVCEDCKPSRPQWQLYSGAALRWTYNYLPDGGKLSETTNQGESMAAAVTRTQHCVGGIQSAKHLTPEDPRILDLSQAAHQRLIVRAFCTLKTKS